MAHLLNNFEDRLRLLGMVLWRGFQRLHHRNGVLRFESDRLLLWDIRKGLLGFWQLFWTYCHQPIRVLFFMAAIRFDWKEEIFVFEVTCTFYVA